jgi:signal transduction histidine kinase
MTYVIITLVVLAFLNVYCSHSCQRLFYQSKETSMTDKAQLAASQLEKAETLSAESVISTIQKINTLKTVQTIVTDASGAILYDSGTATDQKQPPLIQEALAGNETFAWDYQNGVMRSEAACPITANGSVIGCVYVMELDSHQGTLLKSIQTVILTITIVLELIVIVFSLAFAHRFSKRLNRIMNSMRIIQEGNYSHKVTMDGHDELTVLGDEFNDLTERLQTSENKRRQFVSDASHELKTPLASIKLLSDSILQNDMDMETVREFVGDIGEEADRLNRMSQKLLDLTRGVGEDAGEMEIICMAPTVERVVRMLSMQAKSCQVEIVTELQNDVPILIREDDLYRIVYNLVENGIKYNIPGGKLTVSLDRNDEWGIMRVSDTGTGIPEDALPHIFERFYRVDKARSRASGGSGLGLAIVRNMIERNQGKIYVKSTFGMGTTFTVKFPAFDTEE